MKDGIDGAFREIERSTAPLLQLLDHGIAVRRAVPQRCEDQRVEMSFQRLSLDT